MARRRSRPMSARKAFIVRRRRPRPAPELETREGRGRDALKRWRDRLRIGEGRWPAREAVSSWRRAKPKVRRAAKPAGTPRGAAQGQGAGLAPGKDGPR